MSWSEFRDFLEWLPRDKDSALFRYLNPDTYIWASPDTRLLAEVATEVSRVKFLTAMTLFEEMPEDYYPATYGPPTETQPTDTAEKQHAIESAERARRVAAEIRGELVG